ncbi:aminotransferase class I/II-fold pyridoxal phosphate-dependent enzyme [Muricauda sp. 2012CJ35-5]|uniref:Aminotransferase class I/II-fold pyridoxal phosphate-dependent enzyme n=1 Tax=Flagellimonas spongiicola TaxID=2942208 RepID=A0ABT0PVZ1_9FLAO|nr:aminotransferase class I/II-fold pyridoxal phosphate-dependent enzyme [Allomuricauda spongiicola]MCL6275555.1 aminotransferase class I/II-fold pyridoxal phosphate-dependent enzyme [Allomuricauda spongiicola]
MTKTRIWLSSPHMGGTEQLYVKEAFDSNWVAPLGPNVNFFENSLESYLNNNVHAAALSSGTGAIHLGLQLLGVGKGDEVLCQSFTFSASANPINYLGATPVFIDSESKTWNISPELLEKAILDRISNGKKPKAIVAVHLYGMPYQIEEIQEISKKYGIPVIEDSAEALGSEYKEMKCGQFGEIGIFSFNGNKIITTSGGGALLTKNESIKQKAVHLATQARDKAPHYQHSKIGYNYRMSNVLAGIGRGQMEVIDDRVAARRFNFDYYLKNLSGIAGIEFLEEPEGFYSNRWLTCILTDSFDKRESIRLALDQEDIESRPLWKPMHLQPVFASCLHFSDGTSEDLFNRGLCLPSGSNMEQEDLERVVSIIKKVALA